MRFRIWPPRNNYLNFSSFVIDDVTHLKKLHSFVTWETLGPREINLIDKPLEALEPQWRLQSQQMFATRDHWRWIDLAVLRRRVYVRLEEPATAPSH